MKRSRVDDQRRIGAGISNMRAHMHNDFIFRHTLASNLFDRFARQPPRHRFERGPRFGAERLLDRLLTHAADVGEAHAVGREQRGQRVNKHAGHAECVRDQAGVLAAGAAEAIERVTRDIIAALHRDFFDRVRHVLDGDLDEAVSDLFGRAAVADLLRHVRKRRTHRAGVERLVLLRPEYFGKEIGNELAGHHIGIGHGQRPAAAIAFRTGIGAGGIRANTKARAVEMQDRAAAGCDRVNQHHRRAHAHAGHLGFEGALVFAGKMRHVRRGAAHIEADEACETG